MTGITRLLNSKSWRYATLEVFLIFIGITLALLANTWYESRNDRQEEVGILGQLLVSLETDVAVFAEALVGIDDKLTAMKSLERHIQDGRPYSPDLIESFSHVLNGSSASMNTAAFETLKFRGLDLISSTALRRQLVDYYDSEKINLDDRNAFDSADVYSAVPYYTKYFRWDSASPDIILLEPVDYETIVADQEFRNILALRIWGQERMTKTEYTRFQSKAESLVSAVEMHMTTLQ